MIPLWLWIVGGGAAAWWLASRASSAAGAPSAPTLTSPPISYAGSDTGAAPQRIVDWTLTGGNAVNTAAGYCIQDLGNTTWPAVGDMVGWQVGSTPMDPNASVHYGTVVATDPAAGTVDISQSTSSGYANPYTNVGRFSLSSLVTGLGPASGAPTLGPWIGG